MTTREALRFGIVGCGEVAQSFHIPILLKIKNLEVAAACDSNEELAKRAAERFRISRYYTDFPRMLEQEKLDTVGICTPPNTHAALSIQAMEAGCHVLVEKPMTLNVREAGEMMSASERSGVKLCVIHNILFEPVIRRAFSLIRRGDAGQIINIDMRFVAPPSDPMLRNKDHWSHSSLGGRFGEMLIHPIYTIQAILGQVKVRSVRAIKIGSHPWVPLDELWVELEGNNSSGSIYASFNSIRDTWLVDIYGTKGIIKVDLVNQTLVKLKQRTVTTLDRGLDSLQQASQLFYSAAQNAALRFSGRWVTGHEAFLRAFIHSVLNDKTPPVSFEKTSDAVETLEQICRELTRLATGDSMKG